jgi:hypothetical protein
MDTIQVAPQTWAQALPALLIVYEHADSLEGKQKARTELERMAFLADQFGKPLLIEQYAMAERGTGDYGIAERDEEIHSYDVMVRCEGEDPIEEFEGLDETRAYEVVAEMEKKYLGASFVEVGG